MRALLQRPAPDYFGGGVLHVEKTREQLSRLGVEVVYTFDLEPDLSGYDLVHLFNTPKTADLFVQCANAQRYSRPLVFSSIYWDEQRLVRCLGAEEALPAAAQLGRKLTGQLYGTILGEADVILTASAMEQGWLTRDFGVTGDRTRVVPLAADTFFAAADPEPFVERAGVRDFVLCSAVLAHSKNQLRLIRALRGFDAPLVLAYTYAETDYEQRCREEAGDNVIFVGPLDQRELASAYAAAKVHALVSCYEPTGLSSIEAGLAGCNLVCTAHTPISEYVGNRAWYADPLDIASIRRAVEIAHRVPRSHVLRNELLANFTWERTARLTLAAYEGLLAVRHATAHRKGEARYRWLTAFHRSATELRNEVMAVAAGADAARAESAPARAQARIEALSRALHERDAQLQAVTNTWAYRLHHYLAKSPPARAFRRLRHPSLPPVFHAPRGPALDALTRHAERIHRVLVVARASGWHVLRAVRDLRRALPAAHVLLAGEERGLAPVRRELPDLPTLELTRSGYGELTGLHDAVIVVGEAGHAAVELAERTGARMLVQYNTSGYFSGSAVIAAPAVWRDRLRRAATRRPVMLGLAWLLGKACAAYFSIADRARARPTLTIACVACGRERPASVTWMSPGTSPYARCSACGLVQLANPPAPAALTEIYEDRQAFQGYLDTRADAVTRFRHERILEHLERWVQPGRMLDVGCADGRFLEVASDAGWEIHGVETSALFAGEAETSLGITVHRGTLEAAGLPNEHFDAVNMSHLFEHVADQRALLRAAHEVLKRGGVLAISTPNVESPAALVLRSDWVWSEPDRHTVLPSRRALAGMLSRAGFDVLEARTVAPGRILGELYSGRLFWFLPLALRRMIEQREPQLSEYLAEVAMGEELLVIARRRP